tara:strand:+ start:55 stop:240 length:186 start_codon:yes stop_codon:yes gene_type:complete
MKKHYKLSIECDDELDETDSLSESLEYMETEGVWLDTGEETILLPPELAKYLEETGILGMA